MKAWHVGYVGVIPSYYFAHYLIITFKGYYLPWTGNQYNINKGGAKWQII